MAGRLRGAPFCLVVVAVLCLLFGESLSQENGDQSNAKSAAPSVSNSQQLQNSAELKLKSSKHIPSLQEEISKQEMPTFAQREVEDGEGTGDSEELEENIDEGDFLLPAKDGDEDEDLGTLTADLEGGDQIQIDQDLLDALDKRYAPRFVGKRYSPRFVGKRYSPRFVGKRYSPRFVGKRYSPRFVGKRYSPRFVGKQYSPRFVGKRYSPRFVGKRYSPRFVGKRYSPRFVGKRYSPRFVGKRKKEETDEKAHSITKRSAPRFVGKRDIDNLIDLLYQSEPFEGDNLYEERDISSPYEDSEDLPSLLNKRYVPRFVGKRYTPRFVGKRYTPRFVGKRYTPRFVGKRYTPRFVGKRYTPRFVGKRYTPRFVGKRYTPRFVGKRPAPRFVGKRQAPRFVGKRPAPRFVGKREDDDDSLFSSSDWDSSVDVDAFDKRYQPRFVGKRDGGMSEIEELLGNKSEREIQEMLTNWSRNLALKELRKSDKRYGAPVRPGQMGKRMIIDEDESDSERK